MNLVTRTPERIVTDDVLVNGSLVTRTFPRWTASKRARKLRKRRLVLGIEQSTIAHALGLSTGAYSAIEQGSVEVEPADWATIHETFRRIAREHVAAKGGRS